MISLSKSIGLTIGIAAIPLLATVSGYSQIPNNELKQLVENLEGDDYEMRHNSRMILQDHVSDAAHPEADSTTALAVEKQLLSLLGEERATTTTLWILRQIESIGSDASVEALAELLDNSNEHVADGARLALQQINTNKAGKALLRKLQSSTTDAEKIGYINALAEMESAVSGSAISPFLSSENSELSEAAASAIAKLNSQTYEKALRSYQDKAHASAKKTADIALLHKTENPKLLSILLAKSSNRSVRSGAFKKYISLKPKHSSKILEEILAESPSHFQFDAIRIALEANISSLTRSVLKNVGDYTAEQQSVVFGALVEQNSKNLESIILKIASTENESLKIQAIEALGRVGTADSLPVLLEAMNSRSRELRETAEQAISLIDDSQIDTALVESIESTNEDEQVQAITALGFRAFPPATDIAAKLALNDDSIALRKAALETIEKIGTVDSLPVLVDIIIREKNSRLKKEAQTTLKRITLRLADPEKTWGAFKTGFGKASTNPESQLDLLAIIDSAPTKEAIEYVKEAWKEGDSSIQKTILRVLSSWRTWDGGFALIDIANYPTTDEATRTSCFDGIGRLILGSDASYDFDQKFELASTALESAKSSKERTAIITGFRYATWRERVRVQFGEPLDKELGAAILEYADE